MGGVHGANRMKGKLELARYCCKFDATGTLDGSPTDVSSTCMVVGQEKEGVDDRLREISLHIMILE